jgi:hypothetical protein
MKRLRWIPSATALVSLLRIAATPALAEAPPPTPLRKTIGSPPAARSDYEDLQRHEDIRRAREEILKNPSQKKFILFRYGLDEDDLR